MKKIPILSMFSLMAFAASAAPIANAPLATPVLVDSTGKLMGRYVNGAVLITVAGETVALPVAPHSFSTTYTVSDGTCGSSIGFTYPCPVYTTTIPSPGLYWKQGRIFFAGGELFDSSLKQQTLYTNRWVTEARWIDNGLSLTRTGAAIFTVFATGSTQSFNDRGFPVKTYASLSNEQVPFAQNGRSADSVTLPSQIVGFASPIPFPFQYPAYGQKVLPIAQLNKSADPSLVPISYTGVRKETALIDLDEIGIAPFFVK